MKITFSEQALDEYMNWQAEDKKTLKRINALIKDIQRNSRQGIGKPETLKHEDALWSRRIDEMNRLVYKISEQSIEIVQCNLKSEQ